MTYSFDTTQALGKRRHLVPMLKHRWLQMQNPSKSTEDSQSAIWLGLGLNVCSFHDTAMAMEKSKCLPILWGIVGPRNLLKNRICSLKFVQSFCCQDISNCRQFWTSEMYEDYNSEYLSIENVNIFWKLREMEEGPCPFSGSLNVLIWRFAELYFGKVF